MSRCGYCFSELNTAGNCVNQYCSNVNYPRPNETIYPSTRTDEPKAGVVLNIDEMEAMIRRVLEYEIRGVYVVLMEEAIAKLMTEGFAKIKFSATHDDEIDEGLTEDEKNQLATDRLKYLKQNPNPRYSIKTDPDYDWGKMPPNKTDEEIEDA